MYAISYAAQKTHLIGGKTFSFSLKHIGALLNKFCQCFRKDLLINPLFSTLEDIP